MSEHLFVGREHAPNGRDQTLEFDRFGIELLAPCGNGLLALALLRMRGHANDRNVPGLRIVLETPHGFPTVVVRHFEVHQDHVRVLVRGQTAALLAVLRCENLEAAAQLEARLEHVQVVVVVFDVEHFGHVTDSVLLTAALITSSLNHLVGAGAWLSTYPAATASATTANTIGTARVTCRKLATAMLVNAMTTSGASAT